MAVNTAPDEDLRKMLECPICLEHFNTTDKQPIAFTCQHPLCAPCVTNLRKAGTIECPSCKNTSTLASDDVAKLPKDRARLELVDILNKTRRPGGIVMKCSVCAEDGDDKLAVVYCDVCDQHLCSACAAYHGKIRATKRHALVDLTIRNSSSDTSGDRSITLIMCDKPGHETFELTKFCLTCEMLTCDKCDHAGHNVAPSRNVYSAKSEEVSEMVNALRRKETSLLNDKIEKATRAVIDVQTNLPSDIESQFQMYSNCLNEAKAEFLKKVDQWCRQRTKLLNAAKQEIDDLRGQISAAEAVIREHDRVTFLKQFKDLKTRLEIALHHDVITPEVTTLVISQVCPSDDFGKIVGALGTLQEMPGLPTEIQGNKEVASDKNGSLDQATTSDDTRCNTTCFPLMEVLKSLSVNSESFRSIQHAPLPTERSALSLPDPTSIADRSSLHHVSQRVFDKGRQKLYSSVQVRELAAKRFLTWNLTGSWDVSDAEVVMYSRSREEAEQCLRLLSDTVMERRVRVHPDTMVLLGSDKWQMVNVELERKYPAQVATSVDHSSSEVVCLATTVAALEDVIDKTSIFLRDNEVRTVTMTFPAETVNKVLNRKQSLDKVRNAYSQFLVQITKTSDTKICVKGIGVGFGKAIMVVNKLAQKRSATDDDRFDSDEDDDDDDDDDRFDDDDKKEGNVIKAGENVDVEITIAEFGVAAICLPGDARMLYVAMGDMTQMEVDAMVNPADPTLKHNGGLAKAMVKKGGQSIQDECKLRVSRHGPLNIGDVFCSSAGNLPARLIIHAVGPKWKDGTSGEMDALKTTVRNSLQSATENRLSSIAFPAIGAGAYAMPVASACDVIVMAVREFLTENPRSSIREIYFCDITQATVHSFTDSLVKLFDKEDTIVCNKVNPPVARAAPSSGSEQRERTSSQQGATMIPLLMM